MEKLSLPKIAYNAIIDVVVDGTLKLGQPVSQTELTKILGMSRTPVREALFALERDGIFTKEGRKYSVCYTSRKEIAELYELRKYLEIMAIKLCMEKMNPDLKRSITTLMKKIKKHTFANDFNPYDLATLNGSLHLLIARGSDNRYLVKFLNEIVLKLKIVRVAILNSAERRLEEYDEHSRIVDSIMDGDVKGAIEAMDQHRDKVLEFAEERVLDRLFYYEEGQ